MIQPMIVVCPTYNNISPDDSGDYSLALRLTENYHRELAGDLIPAVEGTYSTYAEGMTVFSGMPIMKGMEICIFWNRRAASTAASMQ